MPIKKKDSTIIQVAVEEVEVGDILVVKKGRRFLLMELLLKEQQCLIHLL